MNENDKAGMSRGGCLIMAIVCSGLLAAFIYSANKFNDKSIYVSNRYENVIIDGTNSIRGKLVDLENVRELETTGDIDGSGLSILGTGSLSISGKFESKTFQYCYFYIEANNRIKFMKVRSDYVDFQYSDTNEVEKFERYVEVSYARPANSTNIVNTKTHRRRDCYYNSPALRGDMRDYHWLIKLPKDQIHRYIKFGN